MIDDRIDEDAAAALAECYRPTLRRHAAELGVRRCECGHAVTYDRGLVAAWAERRRMRPVGPDKVAAAKLMRERGALYAEIGEALDVHMSTAWHWVHR